MSELYNEHRQEKLPGNLKKNQYEELGRYLANHCHALLALWDGIEVRREEGSVIEDDRGGTADVVRMKLEKDSSFFDIGKPVTSSDPVTPVSVFHIATPRFKGGRPRLSNNLTPGKLRTFPARKRITVLFPTVPHNQKSAPALPISSRFSIR